MGFGRMEGLVGTMEDAVAAISAHLDRLDEQVAALRGSWTGEASDAYDKAQRINRQQLAELNRFLKTSGGTTRGIIDRHSKAAAAVAKLWG